MEKVALEVSAPDSGMLSEIAIYVGATVNIIALLGFIDTSASGTGMPKTIPQAAFDTQQITQNKVITSPAARKIAADNEIDLSSICSSVRAGRITKGDVLKTQSASGVNVLAAESVQENIQSASTQGGRTETKVTMTSLHKTIAKRLKNSQNTVAILSTFNEIDMFEVI